MAEKREVKEFESLSAVGEAKCANVNGVVACVSPMKQGKRAAYFEAKITDRDVNMRVVEFQGGQQQKLAKFQEKAGSVSLQNCQIKRARLSDEFEILLGSSSRVQASPKKFMEGDLARIGSTAIQLDEL